MALLGPCGPGAHWAPSCGVWGPWSPAGCRQTSREACWSPPQSEDPRVPSDRRDMGCVGCRPRSQGCAASTQGLGPRPVQAHVIPQRPPPRGPTGRAGGGGGADDTTPEAWSSPRTAGAGHARLPAGTQQALPPPTSHSIRPAAYTGCLITWGSLSARPGSSGSCANAMQWPLSPRVPRGC